MGNLYSLAISIPAALLAGFITMAAYGMLINSRFASWFKEFISWFWDKQTTASVLWVTTFICYIVFSVSISIANAIDPEFRLSPITPWGGAFLWLLLGILVKRQQEKTSS